jgi:translation initiation factor 2A
MPAKATLFDHRVRPLHDFGSSPQNYVSFNSHGTLIALGGFGNLAGQITIFDRRTLQKVSTISAPNTSYCSWSPDGRFILTATLSPRLRVDNGIKIWHCSGPLLHVQLTDELYQAEWRPCPLESVPAFGATIPAAPAPCESVQKLLGAAEKPASAKPAGAYRPPGARGLATPAIFKREDEGGPGTPSGSGTNTPSRGYSRSPVPPGASQGGAVNGNAGRRYVPGAAPPQHGDRDGDKKGRKKRGPKEEKEKAGRGENGVRKRDANGSARLSPDVNEDDAPPVEEHPVPTTETLSAVPDPALDPIAKKIRNLNKKVSRHSTRLYDLPIKTRSSRLSTSSKRKRREESVWRRRK